MTISGNIASNTATLYANGGILLLESNINSGATANGGIIAAKTGSASSEVDLNGATLTGPTGLFTYLTLGNNSSGYAGPIKLTGNSAMSNNIQTNAAIPISVNGNTLTVNNFHGSFASGSYLDVGTGNLTVNGPASVFSGGNVHLGGGNINYTTSSATDTLQASVVGYGDIKTKLLSTSGALATASGSGQTLYVDGGAELSLPGDTYNNGSLASGSGATLDIRSTINNSQPFTSYVSPNAGIVILDGATLATGASANSIIDVQAGTVNVKNHDSTLTGNIQSEASITIDGGINLNMSGATLNLKGGSITNNGNTLVIGAGTLNNGTASTYSLGGGGTATLAGGSITSTGGGGFTSNNTLSGYGTVSAAYTNQGKVVADGAGTDRTLAFTSAAIGSSNTGGLGWFAQNHGKLTLPSIAVNSATAYNWGGDPTLLGMVNSVGLNFHGAITPGNLSISLLSPDRTDVPPGLVDAVDVWQFDPGTLRFGTVDLTFRYDDAAAAALGVAAESIGSLALRELAMGGVVGTTNNISSDLLTAYGLTSLGDYAIAKVPEPTTVIIWSLLGAGGWLGMRASRRRRGPAGRQPGCPRLVRRSRHHRPAQPGLTL